MPVLGLRGTGSFSADDRPKNYREILLFLKPNTEAPLTALMGRSKEKVTDDAEFKWFEKGLPQQRVTVSGSQTSSDTTIEITGSAQAKIFKKGHAVINERTLEVFWVTADPSSPHTSINVGRGKGSTAAAMNDLDGLLILGSHHPEGAAVPTAVSYDATVVNNFTEIFRTTLDLTETARVTRLRWDEAGPMREAKREALELHSIEMEKQFLFGSKVEDTSGAQPERTTQGLNGFVTSNVKDFADAVDIDSWENFLEDIFEDGSNEKLALIGNRALNVINKLVRNNTEMVVTPKDQTFGMAMTTYLTPYGTLMLRQHPLLSKNATFNDWGFIVDMAHIVIRPLRSRDTTYKENRQDAGTDARKDEYLSEIGLEVNHESTHAIFKNASAFSA